MAKTNVKSRDPYRFNSSTWLTREKWLEWEKVGMAPSLDLDDLKLNWVDPRVADLGINDAIEAIQFDRTIEGASTVAITLRDPRRHIFSLAAGRSRSRIEDPSRAVPVDEGWSVINMTDVIGRAVEIELNGVAFRLVKIEYDTANQQVTLTFEDRIIYWLRRKKGVIRSSRAQVTRAEFILRLLREIREEKVPFVSPDLHIAQAIAPVKSSGTTSVDPEGRGGFSKGQRFTVQGGRATAEQKRNMDIVLEEASSIKGATKLAIKAVIEAVIVESFVKNLPGGDKDSRGILQVRDSTAGPLHLDNRDIRAVVRHFMLHGYTNKGGAIALAKSHKRANAGWIAQQVQGSAFPARYQKWSREADHWYKAWTGEGKIEGGGGTYVKSFQFARDKDENSWEAMTRLAEEVGWRIFPVGKVMYFMSEEDLFRRRIRHVITPDSEEALSLRADIDWGKAFNTATLVVNLDRWGAPPGCVIELEGWGPVDGRWLVVSSTRDWFSPTAELTLRQPGEEKREPASERVTRSDTARAGGGGGSASGKSGKLYEEAKRISDHAKPYDYGGNHGPPLSQMNSSEGFDCSSSCSLALYRAGMWPDKWKTAIVSGMFDQWGQPGRGEKATVWYHGGHVFIDFEAGMGKGMSHKRFDTSAYGTPTTSGPRIRTGERPHNGFRARHWPGT